MDSPRSGFRRAAAASWALTGIGIVGVGAASALAYADTVKPAPAADPAPVVDVAPPLAPPPPVAVTTTVSPPSPPPPAAAPTVEQAPLTADTWTPEYTPQTTVEQAPVTRHAPVYTPQTTVAQTPVTEDTTAPAPTDPPKTQYHRRTPTPTAAPSYSPPIVRSRGS
ncbi:hypothetical protein Mycch_0356 [Mycolicibacterium chubuense NBB4]|uniref:Uncharacterized protein n=1 Tax=Mycolicibacterium chubuense (strain NBB4) TaxID=710421 RepID=I4BD22_MYCCN|nr:hypothetical protein [Mycolicibacterium chubuense]AFM15179.1 hypothetical protein Mycch_0356 [Mycolicibacterium chubuense NBB4]